MQFAKDSFYLALRERLAALNPARVVSISGITRVALIVMENEPASPAATLPDCFYLQWGAMREAVPQRPSARPLLCSECVISYDTAGTCLGAVDRGRTLSALDRELLSICHPATTRKRDFTQAPSIDLGTNLFWTFPEFGDQSATGSRTPAQGRAQRAARLTVFFFPEVDLS